MSYLVNPYMVLGSACTYQSGTSYTGWTFTGDYAISSGTIQANIDTGYSNNGSSAYYDIGTANISETAWIMRWIWELETITQSGGSPAVVGVGLYSDYPSAGDDSSLGGDWDPTQQLAVIFASAEGGQRYFQTCTGNDSTNFYGTTTRSNLVQDQSFTDTYYMQIQRWDNSGTDTLSYSYTDQSDWSSLTTCNITDTDYMPDSLRYLKAEAWQYGNGGLGGSGLTSKISDFKFNNDTSDPCE